MRKPNQQDCELLISKLQANWDVMKLPERGAMIKQLLEAGYTQSFLSMTIDRPAPAIYRAKNAGTYWKGPRSKHARVTKLPNAVVELPEECHNCANPPHEGPCRRTPAVPLAPAKGKPTESWTVRGEEAEVTKYSDEPVKTLEQLIRVCEIDTNEWDVKEFTCNIWGVTMKPAAKTEWVTTETGGENSVTNRVPMFTRYDDEPVYRNNYQVKAWLKRKTELIATRNEIAALIEQAKKHIPLYRPFIRVNVGKSGNMLEISMPDLHLGKYAWGPETGGPDWDIHQAKAIMHRALEALVSRSCGYQFDEIVFVVGNDFFNSDNKSNLTTKGTPQSTDTRYPKMVRTGREMVVSAVDRLTQIAPVRVVVVPGNHDEHSSFHLGEELSIWYRNCPDVTVDNSPSLRKWYQFGDVMLMWTHGDKERKEDLNGIMSSEQPKMWGDTKFREAHVGHLHKTMVNEKYGMRWRILSALCPADSWHAEHGYIGNLRGAEAFIWNRTMGLMGTAVYTEREAESELSMPVAA